MKFDQATAIKLLAFVSGVSGELAGGLSHTIVWPDVVHHVTYLSIGLMGALGLAAGNVKLLALLGQLLGAQPPAQQLADSKDGVK